MNTNNSNSPVTQNADEDAFYARVEAGVKTMNEKPKIVCLCGSMGFFKEFRAAETRETKSGNAVFSMVDCGEVTPEFHEILDAVHRRKIESSDEILVLNVGGYIGKSTKSEIQYAAALGKRIRWLEPLCECQRRIKEEINSEPSAGHDYVDEVLGLLRVARSQRG